MFKRIKQFFQEGIWNTPLENRPIHYSFLIRQIRIIIMAFRGFLEDRLSMRASALTYYTLLSVVPIAAMAFGVAAGFGFREKMEVFIIENFKGQEEVMNYIIDLSSTVLEDVDGGLLAGIGLVVLIWSVMEVLKNIESSFNAIWQVKKSRSFFRQLSDYLAIMLIAPILIIVSSSLSVYVSTSIDTVAQNMEVVKSVSPYLEKLFQFLPYVLIWLLFTVIYVVMPNTKVNFKYALIAGIIAGTLFQVVQWAYIHFQVGVSKYSALYGTFAALPFFLAWLQISWLIVLLGAEISFAYQNVENYEFEIEAMNISAHHKKLICLYLVHYIVKKFANGDEPPTSEHISQNLGIPVRLVRNMLYILVQVKVLNETVTPSPKEMGYQPAIDIARINVEYVMRQIDHLGGDQLFVKESLAFQKLITIQDTLWTAIKTSDSNVLLKDI